MIEISREIIAPRRRSRSRITAPRPPSKPQPPFADARYLIPRGQKHQNPRSLARWQPRRHFPARRPAAPDSHALAHRSNNGIIAEGVTASKSSPSKPRKSPASRSLSTAATTSTFMTSEITDSGTSTAQAQQRLRRNRARRRRYRFRNCPRAIGKVRGNGIWIRSTTSGAPQPPRAAHRRQRIHHPGPRSHRARSRNSHHHRKQHRPHDRLSREEAVTSGAVSPPPSAPQAVWTIPRFATTASTKSPAAASRSKVSMMAK